MSFFELLEGQISTQNNLKSYRVPYQYKEWKDRFSLHACAETKNISLFGRIRESIIFEIFQTARRVEIY